jgi:lipopolysaccharide export system permease protein
MPILWRYLLYSYFQVFGLCVSGFISVLLVMRFQEIARFACASSSKWAVLLFSLYQTPSILGYAIPISCLIAAILLFQKLSHSHELTALRAAGLGLKKIIFPLILASVLISLVNITIVCEVAPLCRGLTKKLIYETTADNPLLLLQKNTMVKLKDMHVSMKKLDAGKSAKDMVAIINNRSQGRLGVMIAKELYLDKDLLGGRNVTFISSVDSHKPGEGFDHLVIENQASMSTKAANLSHFIQNAEWLTNNDYLSLRMMLAKDKIEKEDNLTKKGFRIRRLYEEIGKRFSIGLAAFTFTLIGIAFGIEISRNHSKKGIFCAIGLCVFFMVCFMSAKSFRHSPAISFSIYLLPHLIIFAICLRPLKRIARGIGS